MGQLFLDDFRGGFENGPWWITITTWLLVLNLGSTSLLVSWLMKYAGNIIKELAQKHTRSLFSSTCRFFDNIPIPFIFSLL
ncbi:hypothetical protein HanPI659440_Chr10g0377231 [Helianthus annuus]|nr:hypothetical protein HanPI659440_Chr10g0377231 [Helianthus annuus]